MSLFIAAFLLFVHTLDESPNIFDPPYRGAGAKFHWFGVAPSAAALPPRTSADGNEGENLGQTKIAVGRNGWLKL
jgi:hypothetical protein